MKKLTEGNIFKLIFEFTLPILLGNALQRIYTLVDVMMVGRLINTQALAAVGAASTIAMMIMTICNGFTSGFAIVIGQNYGANNQSQLKKALASTYVLAAFLGVFLTAIALIFINPMLRWTKVPENIIPLAADYLRIMSLGIIAALLYNMMAHILRNLGDSLVPLVFLIVSVTLNIGLDYIFIAVLKAGIKGAALATVISQAVSGVSCVIFSIFKRPAVSVKKSDFILDTKLLKHLLSQGFAMALMLSIVSMGSVILQSGINILGYELLAGYTAGRKYLEFFMLPGGALSVTAAAFASQNYGARNFSRIREGVKKMLFISWIWSTIAIVIVYVLGRLMVTSITGATVDEQIIQNGVMYLRVGIPAFYFLCTVVIVRSTLQGMNMKKTPVMASVIELAVKILAVAFIVPHIGYIGICITEPIIWILCTIWLVPVYLIGLKNQQKSIA